MFNINLLKKELLQAKVYVKHAFLLTLLYVFLGRNFNLDGLYFFIILPAIYTITASIDIMDGQKKGSYIINSLPVTRREVVISKYLSSLIYTIIATIILKVITHAINPFGIKPLDFKVALNIILGITLYNTFSYVLYFCFNNKISQIITLLVYTLMCIGSFMIFTTRLSGKLNFIIEILNSNLRILIVVLICLISVIVSLNVYEKKDL
ncbi:ABC-2 transporter permease [Clostridium niameyense]|uniref:ABC-2 transporter permease n=1 Tax=Clostridium niameyense TaxID=1622073 RepID=A0A6M0RBS5_9CLOT|nr:ABC-2 transporter permease [Clostridium niameyense]NEZ47009.1 ABC-2 transporter permease [Clostridium niameyense]